MPSNWLTIDNGFPSFTGEEPAEQQIKALHNYLYQLREGLQYSLRNLTTENFNATALDKVSKEQKDALQVELNKVYNQLNQLRGLCDSMSARLSNLESKVGDANTEIDGIKDRLVDVEDGAEALGEWVLEVEQDTATQGQQIADLEEAVNGADGVKAKAENLDNRVEKIESVTQVSADGSTTVGTQGKDLRLVGNIYINGVLFEGGTA